MRLQLTLRRTDADLISFFRAQDKSMASLIVTALYHYIQGLSVDTSTLNPVVIVPYPSTKINITVLLSVPKESSSNQKRNIYHTLNRFLEAIPYGTKSLYVKGILRTVYGDVIYQTNESVRKKQDSSIFEQPHSQVTSSLPQEDTNQNLSATEVSVPQEEVSHDCVQTSNVSNTDEMDIFDMFESILGG